jgi:predicted DNA-binding transcriptional regulator AlpA
MDYTTTERWLSLEEIAEHLGVSKDTIYRWIAKKQMPRCAFHWPDILYRF